MLHQVKPIVCTFCKVSGEYPTANEEFSNTGTLNCQQDISLVFTLVMLLRKEILLCFTRDCTISPQRPLV